jgi:hypothetical protein
MSSTIFSKQFDEAIKLGINIYPPVRGCIILTRNRKLYYTGNEIQTTTEKSYEISSILECEEEGIEWNVYGGVRDHQHLERWIAVPRNVYKETFYKKQ